MFHGDSQVELSCNIMLQDDAGWVNISNCFIQNSHGDSSDFPRLELASETWDSTEPVRNVIHGLSLIIGLWDLIVDFSHFLCLFIELDYGKNYRKALYLMVKTMVSCRFSLYPIQWFVVLRNPRKSHRFQRIFDTKTVNKQPRWKKWSPESLVARVPCFRFSRQQAASHCRQDPHIIIMCLHVSLYVYIYIFIHIIYTILYILYIIYYIFYMIYYIWYMIYYILYIIYRYVFLGVCMYVCVFIYKNYI